MKKQIVTAIILAAAILTTAPNASASQKGRMKECNANASGKKGDERKQFMRECLSGGKTEARPEEKAEARPPASAQQNKMKVCNGEAREKGLKGDERKKFMRECLKG